MNFATFDAAYVNRLRTHDEGTEAHFVTFFAERLRHKLQSYPLHIASPVIDDVIQETLLRAFSAIRAGDLREPRSMGSFVNAICRNVLSEVRRGTPRPIDDKELDMASDLDIEDEVVKFQDRAFVNRVLEALPDRDRDILRARFFEERDKEDICRQFGIDPDYLRVLLHRAIARFGELYRELADQPEEKR